MIASSLHPGAFLWILIIGAVFLILFLICKTLYYKDLIVKAQRISTRTREPITPDWLKEQQNISKLLTPYLMIQCRPFTTQYTKEDGKKVEKKMEVIGWTQALVNKKVGRITIPNDAVTVSIPMKNFKNGSRPTDFIPTSGELPESCYTYHWLGDRRIQVTTYVECGRKFIAGYCIYIPSPYEQRIHYRKETLEDYYKLPKYFAMSEIDGRDPEEMTKDVIQDLKLTYCARLKMPATIGKNDGIVKHFDWCPTSQLFRMSECSSCLGKPLDDCPPSYSSLNFQKV